MNKFIEKFKSNNSLFILAFVMILVIIILFVLLSSDWDGSSAVSTDDLDYFYEDWQAYFEFVLPPDTKVNVKRDFSECFNNYWNDIELSHEDIVLKNYDISDDMLSCIKEEESYWSWRITRGDFYLNINWKMVIYSSSSYDSRNFIKLGWQR